MFLLGSLVRFILRITQGMCKYRNVSSVKMDIYNTHTCTTRLVLQFSTRYTASGLQLLASLLPTSWSNTVMLIKYIYIIHQSTIDFQSTAWTFGPSDGYKISAEKRPDPLPAVVEAVWHAWSCTCCLANTHWCHAGDNTTRWSRWRDLVRTKRAVRHTTVCWIGRMPSEHPPGSGTADMCFPWDDRCRFRTQSSPPGVPVWLPPCKCLRRRVQSACRGPPWSSSIRPHWEDLIRH